jgi:hypothetical protein
VILFVCVTIFTTTGCKVKRQIVRSRAGSNFAPLARATFTGALCDLSLGSPARPL